jgi:hypothetical protein
LSPARLALTALSLAACVERDFERPPPPKAAPVVAAAGPTLAVYMVGGNLEDSSFVRGSWQPDEGHYLPAGQPGRGGAGSDDLRELVAGWRALGAVDGQRRVSLWVGFGGARKTGWRGIRYADGACLASDAADDLFGNARCYAVTDEKADLSTPEPLAAFLQFVKARLGRGPNVLVLWGQGGAHEGIFYDTVHQELPFMRLPRLRLALARADVRFEVLAMDASMMASLEALEVVYPYAGLVVAAPERMPGHGFDYRALVGALAAPSPAPAPLGLARGIAAAFMGGQSRGKTITVVDTTRLPEVIARLDQLVAAAKPAPSPPEGAPEAVGFVRFAHARLVSAFLSAPGAGRERLSDTTEAVDLSAAAARAGELPPPLGPAASALGRALEAAVVEWRRDPGTPWPVTLTILAPTADKLWRASYEEGELLSRPWRAFVAQQVARQRADVRPPVVKTTRGRVEISDDGGLARVEILRTESTGPGRWRAWHTQPVSPGGDRRTVAAAVPAWDGRALWLCSGTCATRVAIPTCEEPPLDNSHRLLSASVLVRDAARKTDGEDATLFVEVAGDSIVDHWVTPLEIDTEARVLFSREQYRLQEGLSVAFYALARTDAPVPPHPQPGPFFDLVAPPRWQLAPLGRPVTALVVAVDLNHNVSYARTGPPAAASSRSTRPMSGRPGGQERSGGGE